MQTIPAHGSTTPRNTIPAMYKWDTSDLYPDLTAWQTSAAALKADLPKLTRLKGRLSDTVCLKQALVLKDHFSDISPIHIACLIDKSLESPDDFFIDKGMDFRDCVFRRKCIQNHIVNLDNVRNASDKLLNIQACKIYHANADAVYLIRITWTNST